MNEWVSAQAERPRVSDLSQQDCPAFMQTTCDVTKAQPPPLGSSANPHVTYSATGRWALCGGIGAPQGEAGDLQGGRSLTGCLACP